MRYRALSRALITVCLALLLGIFTLGGTAWAAAGNALTYDQIRNTGLANNCPTLDETSRGSFPLEGDTAYMINGLCLQPTAYFVKEEPKNKREKAEYVPTKLVTRKTSTIDQVSGALQRNSDGSLTFVEDDGFDFQATTVQLPGGERVAMLFSIKNLVATTKPNIKEINTSTDFSGDFNVPAYRTSNFLDPKGRGLTTGYDTAVALPASGDDAELTGSNVKRFNLSQGHIDLNVSKVDGRTGEIAGVFVSEQESDDDMGAHGSREVKIQGVFYGRVEPTV
jgi:photosystem II oxygen-evolving enhancer protein 1